MKVVRAIEACGTSGGTIQYTNKPTITGCGAGDDQPESPA